MNDELVSACEVGGGFSERLAKSLWINTYQFERNLNQSHAESKKAADEAVDAFMEKFA